MKTARKTGKTIREVILEQKLLPEKELDKALDVDEAHERRGQQVTTAGKDNLTRVEAQERGKLIDDVTYEIALNLRTGAITFDSQTIVRFGCTQPGASTFIDLDAVELQEVVLNGTTLDVKDTPDGRIPLSDLQASNELVVKATCEYSKTGTGLHRTVDPVDKEAYTYTQFEPFDAHRVFACFDQPDLKATFVFDVEVPEGWVVVSNTRPNAQAGRRQSRTLGLRRHADDVHLPRRDLRRARTRACSTSTTGSASAGGAGSRSRSTWTPDELFEITKAGLRLLRPSSSTTRT